MLSSPLDLSHPLSHPTQDTVLLRFGKLDVSRVGDERRFKEHRLPWDPAVIRGAQQASLHLMVKYTQ